MDHFDQARRNERRFIFILVAALGIPTAVALGMRSLARLPAQTGRTSLLLVESGSPRGGAGVTSAPAVEARQIDQRLLEAAATTGGEVEVSLAWNSLSDLDLQVREPSGELVSAHHWRSTGGGVQDVDANPTLVTEEGRRRLESGQNPGPENVIPLPEAFVDLDKKLGLPEGLPGMAALPGGEGKAPPRFTRTPVEHVYYARAPKGTYTVYAHCYSWREPSAAPLSFTVQVRSHGQVFHQATGTLGPESFITHHTVPAQVCRFVVR